MRTFVTHLPWIHTRSAIHSYTVTAPSRQCLSLSQLESQASLPFLKTLCQSMSEVFRPNHNIQFETLPPPKAFKLGILTHVSASRSPVSLYPTPIALLPETLSAFSLPNPTILHSFDYTRLHSAAVNTYSPFPWKPSSALFLLTSSPVSPQSTHLLTFSRISAIHSSPHLLPAPNICLSSPDPQVPQRLNAAQPSSAFPASHFVIALFIVKFKHHLAIARLPLCLSTACLRSTASLLPSLCRMTALHLVGEVSY